MIQFADELHAQFSGVFQNPHAFADRIARQCIQLGDQIVDPVHQRIGPMIGQEHPLPVPIGDQQGVMALHVLEHAPLVAMGQGE